MLIAHILREKGRAVHTISAEETLEAAARELARRRVGALVVLDEDDALAGVISERDIVREVGRRGASCLLDAVSSAMTRAVITATPMETVEEALERMSDRRIRHLPVAEGGRLVGVVSIGDLVARKIAQTQAEADAMRSYIAAG